MKALRVAAMTCALALGGTGTALADPGDGLPPTPPHNGPTCYGRVFSQHVWNLVHPMEMYGIDSCTMNMLIARKRAGGTFAQFMAAMVIAKYPAVGVPASILTFFWNYSNDSLSICHAPGTGVELTVSNMTGQVIHCSAQ